MQTRTTTKVIHGMQVRCGSRDRASYEDEAWSPTMSLADARKLHDVRLALRRGDNAAITKLGRVFELMPVSA